MVGTVNNDHWFKAQTFWIASALVIFRTYRRLNGSTYVRCEYERQGKLRPTAAVPGCGITRSRCRGRKRACRALWAAN